MNTAPAPDSTPLRTPGFEPTPCRVDQRRPLLSARCRLAFLALILAQNNGAGRSAQASPDPTPGHPVLKAEAFRHYVDNFNREDRETVVNHIPNAAAWQWMSQNIPRFDCADKDLEEIY